MPFELRLTGGEMPITVEFKAELHRIDVVGVGEAVHGDRPAALAHCVRHLSSNAPCGVLVDARAETTVPASTETQSLADAISGLGSAFGGGIAVVVCPGLQFGIARMLEALLGARGVSMAAHADGCRVIIVRPAPASAVVEAAGLAAWSGCRV